MEGSDFVLVLSPQCEILSISNQQLLLHLLILFKQHSQPKLLNFSLLVNYLLTIPDLPFELISLLLMKDLTFINLTFKQLILFAKSVELLVWKINCLQNSLEKVRNGEMGVYSSATI